MSSLPDPRVVPIQLRNSAVYLVIGQHPILVDAGGPGDAEQILEGIRAAHVDPETLRLIVLTHGHIDHFGSAHDLKRLTNTRIAMHPADAAALAQGRNPPTRMGAGMGAIAIPSFRRCEPDQVDVELQDGTSLHEFGVAGRVLHTPGHTPGSVSVVLDNGHALVGDLLEKAPVGRAAGAEGSGRDTWARSIERVLEAAPRVVHRGHGGPLDGPALVAEHDGIATMDRIVAVELGEPVQLGDHAEGRKDWLRNPPLELEGLALSGGGIRSATFNLGLLQGLDRLGLLERFHYVSTVSGGGYLGGFWTAWRFRNGGTDAARQMLPAHEEGKEAPEIRHLREFSNFLSPRLGLLTVDTGRMLVSGLSSTLPALLAALSVVGLASFAWLALAWILMTGGPWASAAALLAVTAGVLASFEREWNRRQIRLRGPTAVPGWRRRQYAVATAAALAAVGTFWQAVRFQSGAGAPEWSGMVPDIGPGAPDRAWLTLFAPAVAWGAGAMIFVVLRWFGSGAVRTFEARTLRSAFDRGTSRLLFLCGVWTAVTTLWLLGVLAHAQLRPGTPDLLSFAGFTATAGALFAWAQKLFSRSSSRPLGAGALARLKPLFPQILAYLTLLCLTVGMMGAVNAYPVELLAGSVLITLLALFLLDPNQVGLHSFYSARLARAYLGASNLEERGNTDECASDDVPLRELGAELSVEHRRRPVHLICCAANDLGNRDHFSNLYRGAVSAALSPYGMSVGDAWSPWPSRGTTPTLASAITASGAAFNSQMGSKSMTLGPAVTFLMTAFNLRLGLWVPHPRRLRRRRSSRSPVGLPFFKEMFGISLADGADVHLSDGGHFENMAVYELVRRHCRYIVASDCGMDDERSFDDFGNLVRRVREDFGVEIDIDLAPLRPGEDGLARQSMVAGDIRYPTGDTGVILLFKPTLVGDEPADVAQYRRRNPAFPHETTGDQFYDEAQWESYRALGEHAAVSAFRFLTEWSSAPLDAAQIFARARRDWQPIPDGFAERISRITEGIASLESLLEKAECAHLRAEVFKEVDEVDFALRRRRPRPASSKRVRRAVHELSSAELEAGLGLVRQALQFMEQIYYSEDLETRCAHPLYLGVMNYCARWAYAPLLRMWWPLHRSLLSGRFTHFMEAKFNLTGQVDGRIREVTELDERGFATDCWTLARRPVPRRSLGERLIGFDMTLGQPGGAPLTVQAALLLVRPVDRVLFWDADNFFVPPGLWGAGVGEAFLDRLLESLSSPGTSSAYTHLLVRTTWDEEGGAPEAKAETDQVQLYRAAGFTTVCADPEGTVVTVASPGPRVDVRRLDEPDRPPRRKAEWLAMDLTRLARRRPIRWRVPDPGTSSPDPTQPVSILVPPPA